MNVAYQKGNIPEQTLLKLAEEYAPAYVNFFGFDRISDLGKKVKGLPEKCEIALAITAFGTKGLDVLRDCAKRNAKTKFVLGVPNKRSLVRVYFALGNMSNISYLKPYLGKERAERELHEILVAEWKIRQEAYRNMICPGGVIIRDSDLACAPTRLPGGVVFDYEQRF